MWIIKTRLQALWETHKDLNSKLGQIMQYDVQYASEQVVRSKKYWVELF